MLSIQLKHWPLLSWPFCILISIWAETLLLAQLFERLQTEDFAMLFTMEDFNRQYIEEHFAQLTPAEQEEVLQALPTERRLAGLSPEQIRQYLDRLSGKQPPSPRRPWRKK